MEKPVEPKEESFRKEALLLEELVRCLSEERENLIHLNKERLWTLMERKEEILLSLQEIRKDRKETESNDCAKGRPFMKPAPRIALLCEEIKARVKENSAFIQEILSFIDDLFRGLGSLGRPEPVYSPVRNTMREVSSSLFHKEV